MQNTITQWVNAMHTVSDRQALLTLLKAMGDRLSCTGFNTAALRIKGGSASPIVQTNAVWNGVVQGKLVSKASGTDCAALVGTVVNATFNVYAHFIDSGGTLTSQMGSAGATLAAVTFPPIPEGKAVVGYVIINPTGTGNFVGGTTNLDAATEVPNAVFVNTLAGFDPTILL